MEGMGGGWMGVQNPLVELWKAEGLHCPGQHQECSAKGPEVKAVMHIHHTYNPTILSSPFVNFKPKPLWVTPLMLRDIHRRTPMSHGHQVGLKLRQLLYAKYSPYGCHMPTTKTEQEQCNPFQAVIPCPHSFLTSRW